MEEKTLNTIRLLLVSREPSELRSLREVAEANGWQLETAHSGLEALDRVQSGVAPNLVLLDLAAGDPDNLHTLRWLRRVRPQMPVILLARPDDTQQMMDALRLGAQDFLLKPCQAQQLDKVLKRQLEALTNGDEGASTGHEVEQISSDLLFVAVSPAMRRVRAQAESLAQVNVPVLILGERGSGKETTARLIHKLSIRSGFRFHKINCAALPGNLLESELFGGTREGVGGGDQAKPGRLELCQRGTIFLDQVSEMPAPLQDKMVQALRDKRFFKNGQPVELDVRILASLDCEAELALTEKTMHEELFYLLSAFTIYVPPLRQRKAEMPILLGRFMNRLARHYGLPQRDPSPRLLSECGEYSWPGNLQELEDFAKRYLMLGEDALTLVDHAYAEVHAGRLATGTEGRVSSPAVRVKDPVTDTASLKSLVKSVKDVAEKSAIADALDKTHWNRKAAARLLRISYRALLYKIQEYQMSPPGQSAWWVNRGTKANGQGS